MASAYLLNWSTLWKTIEIDIRCQVVQNGISIQLTWKKKEDNRKEKPKMSRFIGVSQTPLQYSSQKFVVLFDMFMFL